MVYFLILQHSLAILYNIYTFNIINKCLVIFVLFSIKKKFQHVPEMTRYLYNFLFDENKLTCNV